jgi:hypothetical protein
LTISDSAGDKHSPERLAFAAMSLAQTNYGVLWGKGKYIMSQSPIVALVVALACPPPYLVVACVLFWIYRNGTPKMSP